MNKKLEKVKCFLLDMDGTVYLGDNLIDGAVDAVKRMNERFRALFLTNNSSAAPSDYVLKLRKMGFEVKDDDVFTSGNATIEYLHAHYPNKRVFLFGNDKLFAQFAAGGINLDEENPELIVVGFDTTFDYDRLTRLCDLIREGVPYITTHGDINCPTAYGYKPDVGSFIALIEKYADDGDTAVLSSRYAAEKGDIAASPAAVKKGVSVQTDDKLSPGMLISGKTADKDFTFASIAAYYKEVMSADVARQLFDKH